MKERKLNSSLVKGWETVPDSVLWTWYLRSLIALSAWAPRSWVQTSETARLYSISNLRYSLSSLWIFSLGLSSYKLHLTSLLHPKSKISSLLSKVHYNKTILNFVVWYVQTFYKSNKSFAEFSGHGPVSLKTAHLIQNLWIMCHGLNCH